MYNHRAINWENRQQEHCYLPLDIKCQQEQKVKKIYLLLKNKKLKGAK
jgi:hypothetical protein